MKLTQDMINNGAFSYERKSSENEDRQIASVESQHEANLKLSEQNGIPIIKTFSESRSAKAPG